MREYKGDEPLEEFAIPRRDVWSTRTIKMRRADWIPCLPIAAQRLTRRLLEKRATLTVPPGNPPRRRRRVWLEWCGNRCPIGAGSGCLH